MPITIKIPEIYEELLTNKKRYVGFYGGRAAGKSTTFALILLGLAANRPLRILCTREIQNTIKDSVHKLLVDCAEKHFRGWFTVYKDRIICPATGSEFIFKGLKNNINEIKSTEGINICWVEEAQSTSKESLEILVPTIRTEGSQIWFSYNRFEENDPVHVFFEKLPDDSKLWKRVLWSDVQGLLSDTILAERDRWYAEAEKTGNFDDYLHIWEGEPKTQNEACILNRSLLLDAVDRDIDAEGSWTMGVDIARFGDDRSVLTLRHGLKMIDIQVYTKFDTTQMRDAIVRLADKHKLNKTILTINIDDGGLNGVSDQLLERDYQVNRILFGAKPKNKEKYKNIATELWFDFRDNLSSISLLDDPEMIDELASRRYSYNLAQQRQVEKKEDYKKRYGKSPDKADSVLLCFYSPSSEIKIRYI